MTRIDHERARELMLDDRIEPLRGDDRRWLNSHLAACDGCSRYSSTLDDAVAAVRMPAVMASNSLVRATQTRVRNRALQMHSESAAMRPIWIAVALVCATATATTPLLWAAFAWVGAAFSLSNVEWRTGFLFAWIAPTLAASFLFMASGMSRVRFRAVTTGRAEVL